MRDLVIVSGAPRSGTSMMMQCLEAGGMTVVADPAKKLDEPGHPGGSYQTADVLAIASAAVDVTTWHGKAIKVLPNFLSKYPRGEKALVIWMDRDIKASLASWRLRHPNASTQMHEKKDAVLAMAMRRPGWEVLRVDYDKLVDDPLTVCTEVAAVVGGLDAKAMAAIPSPEHRHWDKDGIACLPK